MKILVILTPKEGKTRDDFAPFFVDEAKAVWSSYKNGDLREFYFQQSPLVVTLIYEAIDLHSVNIEVDSLPMVEFGLLDRQVIQLGPLLPLEAIFEKTIINLE